MQLRCSSVHTPVYQGYTPSIGVYIHCIQVYMHTLHIRILLFLAPDGVQLLVSTAAHHVQVL